MEMKIAFFLLKWLWVPFPFAFLSLLLPFLILIYGGETIFAITSVILALFHWLPIAFIGLLASNREIDSAAIGINKRVMLFVLASLLPCVLWAIPLFAMASTKPQDVLPFVGPLFMFAASICFVARRFISINIKAAKSQKDSLRASGFKVRTVSTPITERELEVLRKWVYD